MNELAHLGPVEMFTPKGDESLAFFVEIMGMEIEAQDGPATYLRGWGDYQRWSLKLIASDTSGMGVLGLRAWSPEALERRVAAVEAAGLGEGWTDGDLGRGPSYRFRDPDGHRFELYYECERYDPPEHLRPALKNVPGRYTGRGCAIAYRFALIRSRHRRVGSQRTSWMSGTVPMRPTTSRLMLKARSCWVTPTLVACGSRR